MCSRSRTKIAFAFAVIASSSQVLAKPEPFRICAEPANLPMSQESNQSGFEIEVARLLAKDMGRKLEVKWVPQRDHSYFGQTLGKGVCDAIMGVPEGMAKLTTTRAWYRTGFVFVTRAEKDAPKSFEDPSLQKLTIGVPATGLGETPPALVLTRHGFAERLRPYSIYEPRQLVSAVAKGEVDTAVVFGPFAGWFASEEKAALKVTPTPDQDGGVPFTFSVSVGVRKGNDSLREKLDQAIEHQRAPIAAVLNRWRVPVRQP